MELLAGVALAKRATHLDVGGVYGALTDILTLQRVLGHTTLAMTQKYAHFSPGHLADVVNLNPLASRKGGVDGEGN